MNRSVTLLGLSIMAMSAAGALVMLKVSDDPHLATLVYLILGFFGIAGAALLLMGIFGDGEWEN
jgi:hypothetical protein